MSAQKKYIHDNRYDQLSKFESVDEFNAHFEQIMLLHKKKFTKGQYIALNKLRKFAYSEYSLETIGVAWCKAQTCVAATHKDRKVVTNEHCETFGISRSTFDRMLAIAVELGIITVYNQKKGSKRIHNVYVFNQLEEVREESYVLLGKRKVVPLTDAKTTKNNREMTVSRKDISPETVRIVSTSSTIDVAKSMKIDGTRTLLLKLPRLKDYKTYQQADKVASKPTKLIDFKETKTEYQQMSDYIHGLFADKKITYKLYGVWLVQKNKMINKPPFELAIRAIRALIREMKRRIANELKPLKNPAGYFYGIVSNLLEQWTESELRRYEENWEQAMINDDSTFDEYNENRTNLHTLPEPVMEISVSRHSYFTNYIQSKRDAAPYTLGHDYKRYINRIKRLLKLKSLLDNCAINMGMPMYDLAY